MFLGIWSGKLKSGRAKSGEGRISPDPVVGWAENKAAWWRVVAVLGLTSLGTVHARPVAIGGVMQSGVVASRTLAGTEMLAVWTLPRLGLSVRNDPHDLRLLYGARELRYSPALGWTALGLRLSSAIPSPQLENGSLYVPLQALELLGVRRLNELPEVINFAAPAVVPTTTLPPSVTVSVTPPPAPPAGSVQGSGSTVSGQPAMPPASMPAILPPIASPTVQPAPGQPAVPVANLDTVRISRTQHRTVEVQRVVLELGSNVGSKAGAASTLTGATIGQVITRARTGLSILLPQVTAEAVSQTLPSGDTLNVLPGAAGVVVSLGTGGGTSEIFTLDNPPRVVIDTTTVLDSSVPPPIDPDNLPEGVTLTEKGNLHLLSFDPLRYQPEVVSAPLGHSSDLASLVSSVQGVGGVNGGYFDTSSALPVDLVVQDGLMVAPSLERRATVGFTSSGTAMFGYPRPRYVLAGAFGSVTVNTVGPKVRRDLLTAFVGDGRTTVGEMGLMTLYTALNGTTVQSALTGKVIPPAGTLALTFDPALYPQLPRSAGQSLSTTLAWRADDAPWNTARDALSAGPLLVAEGKVVLNPQREMFNTSASIWRATRQVALGTLGGKPTLAYFDYGTPETFAAALAGAGVRDAVRMDSGSSAAVYLSSGYGTLGGYLNTVWSQKVPNAIVFVPRKTVTRTSQQKPPQATLKPVTTTKPVASKPKSGGVK